MSAVERRVIAVLARAVDASPASITPDVRLSALGIGSLEQIECVLALEDDLQVELGEPDLRALRTVGDVIAAVDRAVANAPKRAPHR